MTTLKNWCVVASFVVVVGTAPVNADILIMSKPVKEIAQVAQSKVQHQSAPIPERRPAIMRVPDRFLTDRGYDIPKVRHDRDYKFLSAQDVLEELK